MKTREMVGEKEWLRRGMHNHLEGSSGFVTGGVRGKFQFLPRLWTGAKEGDRGAAHTDLSFLSGRREGQVRTDPGVPHTSPRQFFPALPPQSHHGAVLEVSGQLSILTGENRASHAEHDTEHRKQGEEGDLGEAGAHSGLRPSGVPSTTDGATPFTHIHAGLP